MQRRGKIALYCCTLAIAAAITSGGLAALRANAQPPPPSPSAFHLPTQPPVDPHFARPSNGAIDPAFYPATPALIPGR